MIRHGASLSRSLELIAQWDGILTVGPLYPVALAISMLLVLVIFIVLLLMFIIVLVTVGMRLSGGGGIGLGRTHGASLSVTSSRFGSPCSISPV